MSSLDTNSPALLLELFQDTSQATRLPPAPHKSRDERGDAADANQAAKKNEDRCEIRPQRKEGR